MSEAPVRAGGRRRGAAAATALGLALAAIVAPAGAAPPAAATRCPDVDARTLLDGRLPRAAAAIRDRRALVVVAVGSSSTAGAGASVPARAYPAQLHALLSAALRGVDVHVVNAGRNGDEVAEMLARFDADVFAHAPDLVVWQFGSNSLLRGRPPEAIEAAVRDGIGRIRERGADLVLMDLQNAPRIASQPARDAMLGMIVRIADTTRTPLFRRHRLMSNWREALGDDYAAAMLSPDGLHLNDLSYRCLAQALAAGLLRAMR